MRVYKHDGMLEADSPCTQYFSRSFVSELGLFKTVECGISCMRENGGRQLLGSRFGMFYEG